MGVKMPAVEELSVGVRGLFQLLSMSRRKNIKKCGSKIDIKESKGASNNNIYIIYIILYTHIVFLVQLSHSLQSDCRATSGLPCIHFTAQALINYQTHSHRGSCEAGTGTAV